MKARAIRLTIFASALALMLGFSPATLIPAAASHSVPVTVTITRMVNIDTSDAGIENETFRGQADMYACVFVFADSLSSQMCDFNSHVDGDDDVEPFHALTFSVPGELSSVAIVMEVWDHDGCSTPRCFFDPDPFGESDDQGDADPGAGGNVDLSLNLATGAWSGDTTGSCSQGVGTAAVRVCWDISTLSASGDLDGDGLLDSWESFGVDQDGVPGIEIPLNAPPFSANPRHKDLFLELDIVAGQAPRRDDIQGMKAAFAAAPINAASAAGSQIAAPNGGLGINAPPNPDGLPGITLHVDTGNVVDPNAREGATPNCQDGIDNGPDGTADVNDTDCQNAAVNRNYLDVSIEDPGAPNCGDSVDNDGDTQIDAADTDCLIGDNLGGGNTVPRVGCLDAAFYAVKNAPGNNFNANRRQIFRYAISGNPADNNPCIGGQGEIGGNDFVEFNHDGGTVMHELGHTLNLHHGGNDDNLCKPNYVSGMDYNEQFGIFRQGGGGMLDYSPPRIALNGSTRGVAPLAQLVENNLSEPTTLDTTDTANQFVFTNLNATRVFNALNQPANWNGDAADPPFEAGPLTVNIDNAVGTPARPTACVNGATNSTLTGFHDWNAISLTFRQFGDSANGAVNFEPEVVPTLEDFAQFLRELNTTDLSISKSDSPDPAIAGQSLFYTLTVTNNGPNTANNVKVTDTLPSGLTFVTDTDACVEAPAGTLTCSLGSIPAGDTVTVTIEVAIPANYIVNTGPVGITNTATVENVGGTDLDPSNNTATASTIVEDLADLRVTKECKPDEPLLAGGTATCTIFVDNLGPSDARNVVVVDTHVSNGPFTISSATFSPPPASPCAIAGAVVTCNLGTEPAGGRTTITIVVTANEGQDINDCATVDSATPDPDDSNNQSCDGVSVRAVSDLSITKTDDPDPVAVGSTLTYTFEVTNNGPSTAQNVVVVDTLPGGVNLISFSPSQGSCKAGVPGDPQQELTCNLDSLATAPALGSTATITVVVGVPIDFPLGAGEGGGPNDNCDDTVDNDGDSLVDGDDPECSVIFNRATVSSDYLDTDNSDNVASARTTVVPGRRTDLEVTKTSDADVYKASSLVTYTITVMNHGPSDAESVVVTDVLPVEKRDRVGVFPSNGCSIASGTVTCSFGTVDAHTSRSFKIFILVKGNRGLVDNTAMVTTSTFDFDPTNNSDTKTVRVGTLPKP